MDKAVKFTYYERGHVQTFYNPAQITERERVDISAAFGDAGGLYTSQHRMVEHGQNVQETVSYWKDEYGYNRWLNDPRTREYLKNRDLYHLQQSVETILDGPYFVHFTHSI